MTAASIAVAAVTLVGFMSGVAASEEVKKCVNWHAAQIRKRPEKKKARKKPSPASGKSRNKSSGTQRKSPKISDERKEKAS